MPNLPPLALYVHIPWCVKKCPYCDFNSHAADTLPEQAYIDALLEDLRIDGHLAYGREISSIFFGGGTPSLFKAESIGRFINGLSTELTLASACEITLEANPGATEYNNLQGLRTAGINRLSIGVQSFNNTQLKALGRIHQSDDATRAYQAARAAGFSNINLDLMHGLPGQSVADALADLSQAIALNPEHLSWYQLTIEPNTAFYSQPPKLPEDDTLVNIYEQGHQLLADSGFHQYEVSAFARAGRQAKHNLNYWQFGDYLAVGAGAHGKITHPDGRIERFWKTRTPADYLNPSKSFRAGANTVAADAQLFEFLMNALRLKQGVPSQLFSERTQLSQQQLSEALAPLQQKGLIAENPEHLVTTDLGYQFLNDVLAHFA